MSEEQTNQVRTVEEFRIFKDLFSFRPINVDVDIQYLAKKLSKLQEDTAKSMGVKMEANKCLLMLLVKSTIAKANFRS